jgi:hypothetical protein
VYLDCGGIGWLSNVVAGMDWVSAHHASPALVNLSVSLDPSPALNAAVASLWNAGIFVVATAANHNGDACLEAGGASGAFTIAASTITDAKASFSNWGTCVKMYAPGENIESTWLGGLTQLVSGTPHVTGVAALYKATFGDAPSDAVANWILSNATPGVITGNPPGTPNLLVYTLLPGSLTVTTSTTGSGLPSSGYTVAVDDGATQAITTNGSVTFSALLPTHHTVALSGVPSNCVLSGANPQTVIVPSGGPITTTFAVSCAAPPVASLTSSCSALTCTFDGTSSTAQPSATYSWSFGDGAAGAGTTATYTYAAAGTYSVTLTVTDLGGSSTNTQMVTVSAPPAI